MVERLDGKGASEAQEVLVHRDEVLIVHATGPRRSQARRQRTHPHPVAMQMGPYHVRGYLHALPGSGPLLAIRRRKAMVPLTEAREQIDWISAAADILLTEMLTMPVAAGQGPLVKDFTGQILTADGNEGATR